MDSRQVTLEQHNVAGAEVLGCQAQEAKLFSGQGFHGDWKPGVMVGELVRESQTVQWTEVRREWRPDD